MTVYCKKCGHDNRNYNSFCSICGASIEMEKIKMKKIVDGKVAIIISKDYGSGWYSEHHIEELVFDPWIVDQLLENARPENMSTNIENYCKLKYGDNYYGDTNRLKVVWLPIGQKFRIHEYDGLETVVTDYQDHWFQA